MNIDELIKAIKEINPDAETSGLKKADLEALLAQLQADAANHNESQKTAADEAPALQGGDISSDAVNNSAVIDESHILASNDESQKAVEGQAQSVPRETIPEDLIKNDIADAELNPAFYVVSEGRAITSKRGILPAGEAVEARDFVGGEDTLKSLLERGLIQ